MMSLYTMRRVADLLLNLAEGEIKTEIVRQVLAEKELFEPYSAFKRLSNFTSNITSLNLREFLEDNNLLIDKKEAYVLIRLFDSNGDGKLSFTEFLNAILPQDEPVLRREATMRPNFKILEGERLPYEVEYGLMRIFEEEVKSYHMCERIRRELALYDDFSLMEAFRELDVDNLGYLDMQNIVSFLEKTGKSLDDAQLKALMRRMDRDGDGKITYSEYLDAFYSADSEYIQEEYENYKSRSRYTSPKRVKPEKDDEYMGYLRKAYTSPKRSSSNLRKSADNFYSPAKKLSFEEDFGYKTPTKKSSAMKMTEDDMYGSRVMSASKKSPLKAKDEQEFVKVLKEIIEYNRTVESVKNDLALRKDFNLFNAFNVFDIERKGYINSKQLERGLNQYGIYPTKDELYLLMKRFDPNYDGIVKFQDFTDLFTPSSVEFAKLMANRQPYYIPEGEDEKDVFSVETNMLIEKFLKAIYNGEMMIESMRQQLAKRPLFSVHDAFKTLDRYEQGYIAKDDFKEIFTEYGIFVTQKDVMSLVERCEHEMKGTGKVTYTDFLREMSPKSLVSY